MSYRETEIRVTGQLVGINKNYKAGHFWLMPDNQIYRAGLGTDRVYSVVTKLQLDKLIEKGSVLKPTGNEYFCIQCNKPMDSEWLLSPVCRQCTRLNYRKAIK